jgi:hypothetical protein
MRSKLTIAVGAIVVAFLLVTNPVIVEAAGRITSGQIQNDTIRSLDVKNNNLKGIDVKDGNLKGIDIANGTVKSADVGDGSLTAADLAPGTIPPPSAIPTVRWALVNAAHTAILAQSGGITIAATSGAGTYLSMGASVAGSSISATNAYTDDDGGFKGSVMATICGGAPLGGTCGAAGTNNTSHVWVFTQNPANTAGENHAFYVSVIG